MPRSLFDEIKEGFDALRANRPTVIKSTPTFQLTAQVKQYGPDQYSLELRQLWPQAQRPHSRRMVQLNLNGEELARLAEVLHLPERITP